MKTAEEAYIKSNMYEGHKNLKSLIRGYIFKHRINGIVKKAINRAIKQGRYIAIIHVDEKDNIKYCDEVITKLKNLGYKVDLVDLFFGFNIEIIWRNSECTQ